VTIRRVRSNHFCAPAERSDGALKYTLDHFKQQGGLRISTKASLPIVYRLEPINPGYGFGCYCC
jgi:hypothetical protein